MNPVHSHAIRYSTPTMCPFELRPTKNGEGFDLTEPDCRAKLHFYSMRSAFVYAQSRTRKPEAEFVVCDPTGNVLHRWALTQEFEDAATGNIENDRRTGRIFS